MFNINKLSIQYKKLLSNFISLNILQVANLILPLLTLPYLIRVLQPEKFGLVMFAQSFIIYFVILVDFGFNFSATRAISVHRNESDKVTEIFSVVMQWKLLLLLLSLIALIIIVITFDKFSSNRSLYLITFLYVIGQAMFPVWYFQGKEDMKYVAYMNLLAKLIFTIFIFIFVKNTKDYLYVPLLNGLGYIIAGVFSLLLIKLKYNETIKFYNYRIMLIYLKDSADFFLSRVSVSIYTSSNAFVLGLFTNNVIVGYYSIADKLYNALKSLFGPVSTTLYPYIAKSRNIFLYKKIFAIAILLNFFIVLIIWFSAPFLIKLLAGYNIKESVFALRLFMLIALVAIPSSLLGYSFLAALGYKNYANYSVVVASFAHLIGLYILYMNNIVSLNNVIYILMITESTVLAIRLYGIKKFNLWKAIL